MDWCSFNEVTWITRDGERRDLGNNLLDMGAVGVKVVDSMSNLKGGDGGGIRLLFLMGRFGHERDSSGGGGGVVLNLSVRTPEEEVVVQ